MKLTIIPSDGAVYKDSVSYSDLDLSSAPANVHALQWNGTKGWVEFVEDENFHKPANEIIDALPSWVNGALAKWEEAKAAEETARAAEMLKANIEVTTL